MVDPVEQIRFANGSTIDVGALVAATVAAPTSGNDVIRLTSLDSSIDGGAGNDTITGRAGHDTIRGGAGNDLLDGGYGDDWLDGGAGDDKLIVGPGNDTVAFGVGSGHDTMIGGWGATVQLGGSIKASDLQLQWRDVAYSPIYDSSGQRSPWPTAEAVLRLSVNGGSDWLDSTVDWRGGSKTTLAGLQFNDGTTWDRQAVYAAANRGTTGSDLLFNGADGAQLTGGDGNDTLYGVGNGSVLRGDGGNDWLFAADGAARLIGGTGNDTLFADAGTNTVVYSRGDGLDVLDSTRGTRTIIEFGSGIAPNDVGISASGNSVVQFGLASGGSISQVQVDYVRQLPDEIHFAEGTIWTRDQILRKLFSGTAGADVISGFRDADFITGGAGDDDLSGGLGSDTLDGGAGDDALRAGDWSGFSGRQDTDVLIGGAGNDRLFGGPGGNVYRFDPGFGQDVIENQPTALGAIVEFGAGILASDIVCSPSYGGRIVLRLQTTGDTVQLMLNANDQVRFADGTTWSRSDVDARIVYAATAGDDFIMGTAGADTLDGLAGDDSIEAGGGNDLVMGSSGNDTLFGDAGNDTLIGGPGNDIIGDSAGDDRYVFNPGDGMDQIDDSAGTADVLALGGGFTSAGVQVVADVAGANAGRYRLTFGASTDGVTLHRHRVGDVRRRHPVEPRHHRRAGQNRHRHRRQRCAQRDCERRHLERPGGQ